MAYIVHHMAYIDGLGKLVGGTAIAQPEIFEQRTDSDSEVITGTLTPVHADYSRTANITAVNVSTSTLTGGEATVTVNSGTWSPAIGDMFVYGGQSYHVTALASATVCTVRPTLTCTAQAVTAAYDCFESEIEWQPLGGTGTKSVFQSVTLELDNSRGLESVTYAPESEMGSNDSYSVRNPAFATFAAATDVPIKVRCQHGRAVLRAQLVRPNVAIRAACSPWRLTGLRATTREFTERVSR